MRRSFSSEVREELCKVELEGRHCALAELSAFVLNGTDFRTERISVQNRFRFLLGYTFPSGADDGKLLAACGIGAGDNTVNASVLMHTCCKRSYIRGCFLTAGTINAPGRNYHLEFNFPFENGAGFAYQLKELFNNFDINAKVRADQPLVYIKEAENIVDALRLMGAGKSLFRFENERISKEIANDVNRKVNCETANLNKTVSAAVLQVNDIKFIREHTGLGYLSEPLEEVALLRLEHETAGLKEIGAMLSPVVSKSGVNHRLRRISEIAEELRERGYGK